jgi:hypothetical protein
MFHNYWIINLKWLGPKRFCRTRSTLQLRPWKDWRKPVKITADPVDIPTSYTSRSWTWYIIPGLTWSVCPCCSDNVCWGELRSCLYCRWYWNPLITPPHTSSTAPNPKGRTLGVCGSAPLKNTTNQSLTENKGLGKWKKQGGGEVKNPNFCVVTPCILQKSTDVSKENIASVFGVHCNHVDYTFLRNVGGI